MTIDKKYFSQNTIFIGNRKTLESIVLNESKHFFEDPFSYNKKVLLYSTSELQIKIDKIREIKNWANQTFDGVKIVIISSFIWGEEVQNALLKILEDTPVSTCFYLISQNKYSFLPTVLSRVFVCNSENLNPYLKIAREVLSLENNERLENKNIKKILSAKVKSNSIDEDDDSVRKDLEAQLELFEAIFYVVSDSFRQQKIDKKYISKIQEIENIIKTEGISINYFIEYLLLIIPKLN
jgi:DNA polymerase III delta prime subunit